MITLGLTGSIAMGKSTAAAMLENMGVHVHDSDATVHKIYKSDQEFKENVRLYFPESYNRRTGIIDRKTLGEIIFNDAEKKDLLESLLHSKVRTSQQNFLKKCRRLGQDIAVLDIPLLFETGADTRCDYVIVVTAPSHIQRARVLNRTNMTEEKFQNILANQMPDSEKRARADFIVNSGLGRKRLFQDLSSVLDKIFSA